MALNSQSLSKEQVLIVGCGDIGQRLAQCLSQSHYEITGLRRHPPADTAYLGYQQCDVSNREVFSAVLEQNFSFIVVTMTPGERSDNGYQTAYVQPCQQLIDILHRQRLTPQLIVFVSSTAVYGQMDGSWVDETSVTEPESFSGKRLLQAEAIISDSGFRHTIVRFSGIYGPNRNRLIEQVRQGKASTSDYITNRIHADDCARCLAYIIESIRHKANPAPLYLATDSTPTPMVDVVTWLAGQMGVGIFSLLDATHERGNKRCSNRRLLDFGFTFRYPGFKDGYSTLLSELAPGE